MRTPGEETLKRGQAYGHLIAALFAARRGELPTATGEIRQAIDLEPDSPEVYIQAATLMLNWMGNPPASEDYAREALQLDPEHAEALRFVADLVAERALRGRTDEDITEALRLYDALARQRPLADTELVHVSMLKQLSEDLDGAIEAARQLVEQRPGDVQANRQLFGLLVQQGAHEEALEMRLRFVVHHPNEHEAADQAARLARSLEAWEQVADVLGAAKLPAAAGTAHGLLGEALLRLGRDEEATVTLEKALAVDSENPNVRRSLALSYSAIGRLADAAALARGLAHEYAGHPDFQLLLARTLDRQRDVEGALNAYVAALRVVEADGSTDSFGVRDSIRRRTIVLYAQTDRAEAAADVIEDLEQPDATEALELRGRLALLAEDWPAARQMARRLRAEKQAGAAALIEGEALLRTGKLAKAEARFADVVALLGHTARVGIAERYLNAGDGESGLSLLREWVVEESENASAHFELGRFRLGFRSEPCIANFLVCWAG